MGHISNDERAARALARAGVLLLMALVLSCGDQSPVGLDTSGVELVLVQGDHQGAEPGSTLPFPFQVKAQTTGNGSPVEDVKVQWEILEGTGAVLDELESRTDSLGLATTRLTLGPSLGAYRVQALVKGTTSPPVEFTADALQGPSLIEVPAAPVSPGDTVILRGSHFSPLPERNVVTFSRIRATVLSSDPQELLVEVPGCLLQRDYDLRVQVGALVTGSMSVQVTGTPQALSLEVGEDRTLDASSGFGCVYLPGEANSLYLAVPHSTAEISGAEHDFSLVSLTGDGAAPVAPSSLNLSGSGWSPPSYRPRVPAPSQALAARLEVQNRWDERLRRREADLVAGPREASDPEIELPKRAPGSQVVPQTGDKRSFKVLNQNDQFEKVSARVRFVSERAVIYLDEKVPSGGFTDQDLVSLAAEFDYAIHPVVATAFGEESDLDANDRVIILFTPAVNRLTPAGSDGYVGGFFYGLDLLEGRSGSNGGEIFYAMVPDPGGQEGPVIPRYAALSIIPAILAHEFEHMVHFNQRMLLREAGSTDALWLSEALAQMAEDLVGQAFAGSNNLAKANQYQAGNWARAQRFLENPSQVSVLASLSPGTLAERGAGWLLLKHLDGIPGQEGLLSALVGSTLTGVENLTTASGTSWPEVVSNWAGALFLDGTGVPVRRELDVWGVNLRMALAEQDGSYPLETRVMGGVSAAFSGTLWSSAPDYFIITPPDGGVTLSAGGPMGALPEEVLGLQTLVVRIR